MDTDVAIVGGGHNGLVAAFYLARAGLTVDLFERRSFLGGAAITEELWPGMHFSTCAHMVHAFHPKIIADLGLVERGLEIISRPSGLSIMTDGTYYGPADHASPRNLGAAGYGTADEKAGEAAYEHFQATLRRLFASYRLTVPPTLAEMRARVHGTADAAVLEQALTRRVSEVRREFLPTRRLHEKYASEVAPIGRDPLSLTFAYGAISTPAAAGEAPPPVGYVRGGRGGGCPPTSE